jgi:hypothetical protein
MLIWSAVASIWAEHGAFFQKFIKKPWDSPFLKIFPRRRRPKS